MSAKSKSAGKSATTSNAGRIIESSKVRAALSFSPKPNPDDGAPHPATMEKSILGFIEALRHSGITIRKNVRSHYIEANIQGNGWKKLLEIEEALILKTIATNFKFKDGRGKAVTADFSMSSGMVKAALLSEASGNEFDPWADWLITLPDRVGKWDGVHRITTGLSRFGMTIDGGAHFQDWAESYFIIEGIRCALYPYSPKRAHPIYKGPPGLGKSAAGAMMIPPELRLAGYFNDAFVFTSDAKMMTERLLGPNGYIFVENSEGRGLGLRDGRFSENSISAIKGALSQRTYGGIRLAYRKMGIEGPRRDVFYITANPHKQIIPPNDDAVDTRLITIQVTGMAERKDGIAFHTINDPATDADGNVTWGTTLEQMYLEGMEVLSNFTNEMGASNPFISEDDMFHKSADWNESQDGHAITKESELMLHVHTAIETFKRSDGTYNPWVKVRDMHEAIFQSKQDDRVNSRSVLSNEYAKDTFFKEHPAEMLKTAVNTSGVYAIRQSRKALNGNVGYKCILEG